MPLPDSGAISTTDILIELGYPTNTQLTFTDLWGLAKQYSLPLQVANSTKVLPNDWWGYNNTPAFPFDLTIGYNYSQDACDAVATTNVRVWGEYPTLGSGDYLWNDVNFHTLFNGHNLWYKQVNVSGTKPVFYITTEGYQDDSYTCAPPVVSYQQKVSDWNTTSAGACATTSFYRYLYSSTPTISAGSVLYVDYNRTVPASGGFRYVKYFNGDNNTYFQVDNSGVAYSFTLCNTSISYAHTFTVGRVVQSDLCPLENVAAYTLYSNSSSVPGGSGYYYTDYARTTPFNGNNLWYKSLESDKRNCIYLLTDGYQDDYDRCP